MNHKKLHTSSYFILGDAPNCLPAIKLRTTSTWNVPLCLHCIYSLSYVGVLTCMCSVFSSASRVSSHTESPRWTRPDNQAEAVILTRRPKAITDSGFPAFRLASRQRWTRLKSLLFPPTRILKWVESVEILEIFQDSVYKFPTQLK